MAWDGPILTDSGGYQVLSLEPKVDEDGVAFRSAYDGAAVRLTPEGAVAVQERLGPDVAMMLDVPVALPAPRDRVRRAMERTLRWAERARAAHRRPDQALFGIVQGGTDPELRAESAAATAGPGLPRVRHRRAWRWGRPPEERHVALEAAVGGPASRPASAT